MTHEGDEEGVRDESEKKISDAEIVDIIRSGRKLGAWERLKTGSLGGSMYRELIQQLREEFANESPAESEQTHSEQKEHSAEQERSTVAVCVFSPQRRMKVRVRGFVSRIRKHYPKFSTRHGFEMQESLASLKDIELDTYTAESVGMLLMVLSFSRAGRKVVRRVARAVEYCNLCIKLTSVQTFFSLENNTTVFISDSTPLLKLLPVFIARISRVTHQYDESFDEYVDAVQRMRFLSCAAEDSLRELKGALCADEDLGELFTELFDLEEKEARLSEDSEEEAELLARYDERIAQLEEDIYAEIDDDMQLQWERVDDLSLSLEDLRSNERISSSLVAFSWAEQELLSYTSLRDFLPEFSESCPNFDCRIQFLIRDQILPDLPVNDRDFVAYMEQSGIPGEHVLAFLRYPIQKREEVQGARDFFFTKIKPMLSTWQEVYEGHLH